MRGEPISGGLWAAVIGLNAWYLLAGAGFFALMFRKARAAGRLGRLGQD